MNYLFPFEKLLYFSTLNHYLLANKIPSYKLFSLKIRRDNTHLRRDRDRKKLNENKVQVNVIDGYRSNWSILPKGHRPVCSGSGKGSRGSNWKPSKQCLEARKNLIKQDENQKTCLSVFRQRVLYREYQASIPCQIIGTLFTLTAKKRKLCQFGQRTIQNRRDLNTGDPYSHAQINWIPPHTILMNRKTSPLRTVADTPLFVVEEKRSFYQMMMDLKKCQEIGVDVEHFRLSRGQRFTALIQISTGKKDYIVDTIPLWDKLGLLNEVFTDARITKVFHSVGNDAYWLKRDFGMCVINAFDTQEAAMALRYRSTSLAFAVQCHYDVLLDKTFQNADWSIRPLSKEMLAYARSDSHYLPFLFDVMTNALIERGNGTCKVIRRVYHRTHRACCKIYMKPTMPPSDIRILLDLAQQRDKEEQRDQKESYIAELPEC